MNDNIDKKYLILIVDDNPTNLKVLSNFLIEEGHEVIAAKNGKSAIRKVEKVLPDLIILDVRMPEMDGFKVCDRLKASPKTKDIPVIFLTAFSEDHPEQKIKGLTLGAVDFISKPILEQEVILRVNVHLHLRNLTKQLQKQNKLLQQEIEERKRIETELQLANQELELLATLDGLTQVANRSGFDRCLDAEWLRGAREKQPLSLILCDVDYFKQYNDHYGHQAGDSCLIRVAKAIKSTLKRPADLVARYGGEEFAVILPNTDAKGAKYIAESIRSTLNQLQIPHCQSGVSKYVTLSLGIVTEIPDRDTSLEFLIAKADKALYRAKQQGRDRLVSWNSQYNCPQLT